MKSGLVGVFILLMQIVALGQTDSVMLRRLNKTIFSCEVIATNSHHLISNYSPDLTDSISRVINAWEQICYKNEPITRVKVLLAIQSGSASDSLLADYLLHYRHRYSNRIESNHMSANFENYKEYFDYVPLKGNFDQWTADWANHLINQQQPNSSAYFVCLFLSNHIQEFNAKLLNKLYKKHPLVILMREITYAQSPNYHPFGFKVGVWVPTGKMATGFKPCTLIGFELGGEMSDDSRLDLVFDIAFPGGDPPIQLKVGSAQPVQTSAKAVINLGVAYTRQYQINKSLSMDAIGGLGYGRVDTDLKKPKKPDEDDSYYGAGAIDFSWGVMLRTNVGAHHQLGLRAMYHYAPYKTFSKILAKDIGNQYFTVALMYRI